MSECLFFLFHFFIYIYKTKITSGFKFIFNPYPANVENMVSS